MYSDCSIQVLRVVVQQVQNLCSELKGHRNLLVLVRLSVVLEE